MRAEVIMQVIYIQVGIRGFITRVIANIDSIDCSPDAIDHAGLGTFAAGLEQCRHARAGLDYFQGLAAVNLDPQSDAVIDHFTDVGSGPGVEPETGRMVGPNYPDLRR